MGWRICLNRFYNIVNARRKLKINKFAKGQIVRISNYLKISRNGKYAMYYKNKIKKNILKKKYSK